MISLMSLMEKVLKGKTLKATFVPYEDLSLIEKIEFHQDKGTLVEFIKGIQNGN